MDIIYLLLTFYYVILYYIDQNLHMNIIKLT